MRAPTKLLLTINALLLITLSWVLLKENYPSKIYSKITGKKSVLQTKTTTYSFNREALFQSLPKDTNAVVFLGNSLTEHYELSEFFPHSNIKNRGISGDVTKGVLQRLNTIIHIKPKKIFIEIGINDVFMQLPNDSVLKNYYAIINSLLQHCADTKIYVQSLFPISNDKRFLPSYDTKAINKNIITINELLEAYVTKKENAKLLYIDTFHKFELDKGLNPLYTIDGVHLSAEGYATWTTLLKPFVEE